MTTALVRSVTARYFLLGLATLFILFIGFTPGHASAAVGGAVEGVGNLVVPPADEPEDESSYDSEEGTFSEDESTGNPSRKPPSNRKRRNPPSRSTRA